MEKVTGIGGFFFRARNPQSLLKWYADNLGVDMSGPPWRQEEGYTVFAPFDADTDYFPADRQWMLNFRVNDLDAMVDQLKAAGVEILTDPEWNSEIGRFVRIHDPEGNPIELWEPATPPG
ncbi:MAG: VOC family protein [Pseudomonadota bacterium]